MIVVKPPQIGRFRGGKGAIHPNWAPNKFLERPSDAPKR